MPHNSQSLPSSSSHTDLTVHHRTQHCRPLGLEEHLTKRGKPRPSRDQCIREKLDPRMSFELGAPGKHHVWDVGGEKWPSPAVSSVYRGSRACNPARRGGESSGLPQHWTEPGGHPPSMGEDPLL